MRSRTMSTDSLTAVLAAAQEWQALLSLTEHNPDRDLSGAHQLSARTLNLLIAGLETRGRLRQALIRCGYGPDVESLPETFPTGAAGLVHDALFALWKLCQDN